MDFAAEYRAIMREYEEAVRAVQKGRRLFDGILGLGSHPGQAACHDAMDQKIAKLCGEAAAEADAETRGTLVELVLRAETEWDGPEFARLMLAAIQRHVLELIPTLDAECRGKLAGWYHQQYPRRRRLPVQDQVLKELQR